MPPMWGEMQRRWWSVPGSTGSASSGGAWEEHPDQKIPELRLASEQDWLEVARADLNSDDDYRQALSKLRLSATQKFSQHRDQSPHEICGRP